MPTGWFKKGWFRILFFNLVSRNLLFPYLRGADLDQLLRVDELEEKPEELSVITYEWPIELALRYHFQEVSQLKMSKTYRVRSNIDNVLFDHVKEIWAPESRFIKADGRLNEMGQSRFYASNNPLTAILEARPKPNTLITLTRFGFRNSSYATNKTAFIAGMNRYRSTAVDPELDDIEQFYERMETIVHDYERFIMVDNRIADLMTRIVKSENYWEYYPTIAFANMVLKNLGMYNSKMQIGPRADALLYPSVMGDFASMNICMEPTTAKKTYAPDLIWTFKYLGCGRLDSNTNIKLRAIKQSAHIRGNGSIEWGEVDTNELKLFFENALTGNDCVEFA